MNKLLWTAGVYVLLGVAVPARGASVPADSLARELMAASGMNQQILLLPDAVRQGLGMVGAQLAPTPDAAEAVVRDATNAIDLKAIRESVAGQLAAGMTDEHLRAALAWFGSPTGKKIVAMETQGAAGSDVRSPSTRDPGSKRLERLRRLMTATRSDESLARTLASMQGLGRAARPAAPGAGTLPDRTRLQKAVLETMQSTCAALSDAELDDYIRFAESPAGAAYYRVAMDTLDTMMAGVGKAVLDAIARQRPPAP